MRRLAFLSFLGTTALIAAAPAVAHDEGSAEVELVPNPGFAYEIAPGSSVGTVLVRIRNTTAVTQSIYRAFPTADNSFDVIDADADSDEHRHPRRLPATDLWAGRLTSTGDALEPGRSYDVQVDLKKLFAVVPGHRYRVTAKTLLRFGPSNRAVLTKLRSKELIIVA